MIDVENAVFNRIATDLRNEYLTAYPDMRVYGEYVAFPDGFPCVSLWQTDNYTHLRTREIGDTTERYVNVTFQTEIYTVGQGKKALAKELADFVDSDYAAMGYTRTAMMVLPNVDRNAFRITLRHTALVERKMPLNGDEETLISLSYR